MASRVGVFAVLISLDFGTPTAFFACRFRVRGRRQNCMARYFYGGGFCCRGLERRVRVWPYGLAFVVVAILCRVSAFLNDGRIIACLHLKKNIKSNYEVLVAKRDHGHRYHDCPSNERTSWGRAQTAGLTP